MTYADLDIVERIINGIDAEHLPVEYITVGYVTDVHGRQYAVKGAELEDVLQGRSPRQVVEIRVKVNVTRLRRAICMNVDSFYDEVYRNLDV